MKKIILLFAFVLFGMASYANTTAEVMPPKSIELTENMVIGQNDISDKVYYLGRYKVYVNGEYIGTYDVYLVVPD